MADHWFREFASRRGFPRDYLTLDVETSGLSPERNLLCAYGYVNVRGGEVVASAGVMLDWTRHPDVDQTGLANDLNRVREAMERQGKPFHHSYEALRSQGREPISALRHLLEVVEQAEEQGVVMVMHNGWRFDVEFCQAAFHNHLRVGYEFPEDGVYDSGVIEKASQLDDDDDPLPFDGETMREFAARIGALRRRGVYWALDAHCQRKYGLFDREGVGGPAKAHDAVADAMALRHLVEEHRRLASAADQIDKDGPDHQQAEIRG